MHNNTTLDALFPRTRQAVLAATLLNPDRPWYLSALARHLRVRPSSLQRELAALVEAGILRRTRDGNRVYYQPDPACPFLGELQGLLTKTAGLIDVLREAIRPFASTIEFAFVYGSVARGEATSGSDVDLMILGSLRLAELAPALRDVENRIRRPINPALFTLEEFAQKLAAGNHFLMTVMNSAKLFLQGDEHELGKALGRQTDRTAHHQL